MELHSEALITITGNYNCSSYFLTDPKTFLEAELEAGKTYYILTPAGRRWTIGHLVRVAFIPVNKGSKYWDKVKEYENVLIKTEPDTVALKTWEDANKPKIKALLMAYETTFKASKQWPKLRPEDGR